MNIFETFTRVAETRAAHPAIEYAGASITYQDLDRVALRIAGGLNDLNPGSNVVLLFDDRIRAITAMLGALAAGHVFIRLDASDPPHRIQSILEDCEPAAILTDTAHASLAAMLGPAGCRALNVETLDGATRMREPASVRPDDLAYVFYTSGSTGRPKGVCQTHRNVLHFIRCYCQPLEIAETDRLSMIFSLSFGAANMHIFGGLFTGATVCAYDMRAGGVAGLASWLSRERISVLHTVPSVFRQLLETLPRGAQFESIRAINLSAEAVTSEDAERFSTHFRHGTILVNQFAATEASVIAQHRIEAGSVAEAASEARLLAVGRCADGVTVTIERPDGTEAPRGESGRVIVESPYLSPGYWRRDDLNGVAFRADPVRPGWRRYRTEDIGRIDSEGLLYFVGREGTRVKLRGQFIDLVEIEAALQRCAHVIDAAVAPAHRNGGPEADLLVAHVLVSDRSAADPRTLRLELARYLPTAMIPSAFVFPESLPTTATGKVDRRALASATLPDVTAPPSPSTLSDDLEASIAAVFARLLRRSPIARDEDFFTLGGDSLLAAELQIELSQIAGRDVLFPEVFKNSTVAGLAAFLRQAPHKTLPGEVRPLIVPLREHGSRPPLFLIHGRLGQLIVSPHFLKLFGDDQPLYGVQARGLQNAESPHTSIEAMASDYVAAIQRVQPRGPFFLGGVCAGGHIAVRMAQMLRDSGHDVLPLLLIDPPPLQPSRTRWLQTLANNVYPDRHARRFRQRIEQRVDEGLIQVDVENEAHVQSAVAVASAMERALMEYRPHPYDGRVWLLGSAARLGADGWSNPDRRTACFSGTLTIHECADRHGQMFDVANPMFAARLTACLDDVHAGRSRSC